jgi:RecA-family ATPase
MDAAELLAEGDPGPTPWLVKNLIVAQALIACVGRWKTTKSYALLYLCIAIATGRAAFGELEVSQGPVVFVNEETGRAALWRRLDALCRGRAIDPEELRGKLFVAANARVRLDDPGWQAELEMLGKEIKPALFCFDPLARMKQPGRKENDQDQMAHVIDFWRQLRDETNAAVAVVHHTGHSGEHMRGSSDLESVWETRLTWEREAQSATVKVRSEHREAEAGPPLEYRIGWDGLTRSMRFDLQGDTLAVKVAEALRGDPEASANTIAEQLGGTRQLVLAEVRRQRGGEE